MSRPTALLDVEVDLLEEMVDFGGELRFTVTVSNLGKGGRFDVTLRYEIYNLKDQVMKFEEETIAIETRAANSVGMRLGDLAAGSYYLRVTALYKDKSAKATSSFKVVKANTPVTTPITTPDTTPDVKPSSTKECPDCNDRNDCTNDYCGADTDYICKHERIEPCCGNGKCEDNEEYCSVDCGETENEYSDMTIWEKLEIVEDIAKGDKMEAIRLCDGIEQIGFKYDCYSKAAIASGDNDICNSIEDESYKDSCQKDFAEENGNSDVCAEIEDEGKRDSCYMDFATKGDYTVCDKLYNKYLKQSCESLKKLSEVEIPS
jgi:hypothetical protein